MTHEDVSNLNKLLWKIKVWSRFFIYKWGGIDKRQLAKRNWQSNKRRCFYANDEIIQYLFFIVVLRAQYGPSHMRLQVFCNLIEYHICLEICYGV
jgi:hypothetical protein